MSYYYPVYGRRIFLTHATRERRPVEKFTPRSPPLSQPTHFFEISLVASFYARHALVNMLLVFMNVRRLLESKCNKTTCPKVILNIIVEDFKS